MTRPRRVGEILWPDRNRLGRSGSDPLLSSLMEAWSLDNGLLTGKNGTVLLASAGGTGNPVGVATDGPPFQAGFIRFANLGKILYTLAALNPNVNVGWTVAGWYRFQTIPTASSYLFGRWLATHLCWAHGSEGVGGSEIDFTTQGYLDDTTPFSQIRTNVANTRTAWFHYVAVYDYSGTDKRITTYINGVPSVKTTAYASPYEQTSSQQWTIAGINKAAACNVNLDVCQFCLWDKALTASDVAILYNGGNGKAL